MKLSITAILAVISTIITAGDSATVRSVSQNEKIAERKLSKGKGGKGKGKGKGVIQWYGDDDKDEEEEHPPAPSPAPEAMNLQCVVASDDKPSMPGSKGRFCVDSGLEINEESLHLLSQVPGASEFLKFYDQYNVEGLTIGSITALIVEAGDAAVTGAPVEDGKSGDINFPFGEIKSIVTVGERSVCEESYGETMVGWPDGMGAYLLDDETVRVVYQSESYGPIRTNEAWAYPVNNGAALVGGSHIQYIDYDREMMSSYMEKNFAASHMVVGAGQHIKKAYNLKGEPLGRRNRDGPTEVGAQYGCTNAKGEWVVKSTANNPFNQLSFPRIEYDWFYQSFCSAHMEEAHQWGTGVGFEDDIFITNEEWHNYDGDNTFVGCTYHALDLKHDTIYAVGAMSAGGFEKSAEINPMNKDYVMIAMSGYNGDYSGREATLQARRDEFGETRPDGKDWVWPENIHPARFYLGIKGLKEDGTPAPESDFLARNGLRYGQIYGYTIDMTENGPTGGKWRDEAHKDAPNGFKVPGFWKATPWRWDGTVRDFQTDGSWDFQIDFEEEDWKGYKWWNANGYDADGFKCEHLSSDARPGKTAFVQGSTAGYFGHYYVKDVEAILDAMNATNGEVPKWFPGEYYVYQGESDIRDQVELNGKGRYTDAPTGEKRNATCNFDSISAENPGCTKNTFEDIDGLEYICGSDCCRVVIQEDSGNDLGERCFISGCLEHEDDGKEITYYLVAVSGGTSNTRMVHKVGIPRGSNKDAGTHEFSGVFDLSGLLRKEDGHFTLEAADPGYKKRQEEQKVSVNDKYIMINVQAGNMNDRIVLEFGSDSGGQVMIYKPRLPH